MSLLPQQLVNELKARAVKGLVQQPAEHGLTTLLCEPFISIPRPKLLKWSAKSPRHYDIVKAALADGAIVQQTINGGFIMK